MVQTVTIDPYELGWVDEAKMLAITDLARSTFHGWARAGIVERDPGGAYSEPAVIEMMLVGALRDYMSVDELAIRWPRLQAEGKVADFVRRARTVEEGERYDLIVEIKHGDVSVARDDTELAAAVRHPGAPRPVVVVDLADRLRLVRSGFMSWRITGRRPKARKAGRPPARRSAVVTELHGQ
ncbi:MAG: hypothetical protein JWQ20_812 [Conexibacter sp.]|nr:hypothetical protein [Conexibacter sp.]